MQRAFVHVLARMGTLEHSALIIEQHHYSRSGSHPGGRVFRQRFAISPSEIARYRPCKNRLQHFPVIHIYDHMISLYDSFVKLP